jgi:Protein of unknown function (DUF1592)/Protein of unknown function (DUF1588)/Protein of unknown function (DUF1587)/Protein of unknown function (DUF1595)/Protein of unknown function (DUF1585)/Planctomycete cytochrome C/Ca-dependent carbohydrate-binding module xylan-binding
MQFVTKLMGGWLLLGMGLVSAEAASIPGKIARDKTAGTHGQISYEKQVTPLLTKYCYGCHGNGKSKGDLALDAYQTAAEAANDSKTWEKVMNNLHTHVMPPEKKPQPSLAEADLITRWIETQVFKCDCDHPDPGRVTLHRLNRAEYNNTIRDLVGINFQPADDFPADDSGYGFDNIGDVLSVPPVLLEKYLAAAEKILEAAIVSEDPAKARLRRFDAAELDGSAPGETVDGGAKRLAREGDIFVKVKFPQDGDYALRAAAYGEQFGPEPPRMTFRLGDKDLQTFDVPVEAGDAKVYEVRLHAPAGTNRFSASYINNFVNNTDKDPKKRGDRNLIIEYLEVDGPLNVPLPPLPETHRRIFPRGPAPTNKVDYAREIISKFASRAYRRPAKSDEVDRLVRFVQSAVKQGDTFERGVQLALQAVLVSPHFLFRGELQPEPNNPDSVHPVNEFALASRLSYFLWSSMPDDELFALAGKGELRKSLDRQVRRMLKDSKSRALVDNFAGQWLQLRNLRIATPDAKTFPDYDEGLRAAMQAETEEFFDHVIREDRSVLDFLNANYTFVNERLARHYGLKGVKGDAFQRVSLKGTGRAGVLTQGAILTLTSNPTRTSPVKRGKYVLENILGTPPPPPPPNVPELQEVKLSGTLRQRMEQHRENPTCASCHARMDPIGFGFENFDGIGAWREKDGDFPIDPGGELVSGERFKRPGDLAAILATQKRDEFVRCLSEKMLTYALGRGLEFYDKCALDQITKGMARRGYRFSSLISEIARSIPFQQRRGEADRTVAANTER